MKFSAIVRQRKTQPESGTAFCDYPRWKEWLARALGYSDSRGEWWDNGWSVHKATLGYGVYLDGVEVFHQIADGDFLHCRWYPTVEEAIAAVPEAEELTGESREFRKQRQKMVAHFYALAMQDPGALLKPNPLLSAIATMQTIPGQKIESSDARDEA